MPSVGIDGFNLALRHGTGIATYGQALANTLKGAGHPIYGLFGLDTGSDPALREVLFFDTVSRESRRPPTRAQRRRANRRLFLRAARPWLRLSTVDVPLTSQVEKVGFADRLPDFDRLTSVPDLFEIAFRHFAMHRRFLRVRMPDPPDVMHWTYPVPVELEGSRNVYTLHDLIPLKLPYTTLDAKRSYAAIVRECARRAAHICTVSESSRRDIIALLDVPADRVTNTYQASPMPPSALELSEVEDAAMVRGIVGLEPQSYFLFFGAAEPKKNLDRLLEAYLSLQTDTLLVIAGAGGWANEEELRLLAINDSHAMRRVVKLDYLPRGLLLRVIRSARAVAFPSLYEGFGLPILEALQLGTPVLTSNVSSLPEVTGEAAVLVDPYDVAAIAHGLRALDDDEGLRGTLRQAGPKRAALFSTARYVERLEAMYDQVMRASPLA